MTIDRLSNHYPQPFTAPIPNAEQVEVFTLQDNVPYRFRLRDAEPGWWVVTPETKAKARLDEPAQPCDMLAYLTALPRFYVICCFRLAEGTWLVVPYNASDAAQRGWPDGEPRVMHLVCHAVKPFDVATARFLAGTLLYDGLDDRLGLCAHGHLLRSELGTQAGAATLKVNGGFQNAYNIILKRRQELEAETRRQAVEHQRQTTEGELRWQLEFMGADLKAWSEVGNGYSVTWEHEGRSYTTTLQRDRRVASAGICLDRTDAQHNLSSIVRVMEEAERLRQT